MRPQFRFEKNVGVEFLPELCEIVRTHVKPLRRRTNISARIDVVQSDVANYAIEPDQGVFFMNNPFGEVVMTRLLANLRSSLMKFPREIWLVYNNPRQGKIVGDSELFRAYRELEASGTSLSVYNT